jgi:Zn-finger in Ran binding protein and others
VKPWECPDCQTHNRAAKRACVRCGHERLVGLAAPPLRSALETRCTWEHRGLRCFLPAGIGTKTPRCTWHTFTRNRPALAEDYDEFERWVMMLHAAAYCAPWTHARAASLWLAVRGERPLEDHALPCASSSCPHQLDALEPRQVVPRAS